MFTTQRRRHIALLAAVMGCVTLAGCGSDSGSSGGTGSGAPQNADVVIMADSAVGHYHPANIAVAAGGTVTWMNRSGVVHNVVFTDTAIPASPLMNNNVDHAITFPEPGSYAYLCTLHPTMTGVVNVE
jgi:plastocyanin